MTFKITPETTNQEIFEYVVNHLRTQGKPALSSGTQKCCYRTKDGLTCAVGCLIPEELYRYHLEGRSVFGVVNNFDDVANYFGVGKGRSHDDDRIQMLHQLQAVHDSADHWSNDGLNKAAEVALKLVAQRHGLNYTLPATPEVETA